MTTYTGKQAFELANVLHSILQRGVEGTGFNLRCIYNLKILDSIVEPVKKLHTDNPKIHEYQQKRQDVILKFTSKDEHGKPIITNNSLNIIDIDGFNATMLELDTTFSEVLEKFTIDAKIVDEFLDEPFDISTLKRVKEEYLPTNLSTNEIKVLKDIIEMI